MTFPRERLCPPEQHFLSESLASLRTGIRRRRHARLARAGTSISEPAARTGGGDHRRRGATGGRYRRLAAPDRRIRRGRGPARLRHRLLRPLAGVAVRTVTGCGPRTRPGGAVAALAPSDRRGLRGGPTVLLEGPRPD